MLTAGPVETLLDCDFETDCAGLLKNQNNQKYDWRRNKGRTNSDDTGPNTDHTLKTAQGMIIRFE